MSCFAQLWEHGLFYNSKHSATWKWVWNLKHWLLSQCEERGAKDEVECSSFLWYHKYDIPYFICNCKVARSASLPLSTSIFSNWCSFLRFLWELWMSLGKYSIHFWVLSAEDKIHCQNLLLECGIGNGNTKPIFSSTLTSASYCSVLYQLQKLSVEAIFRCLSIPPLSLLVSH